MTQVNQQSYIAGEWVSPTGPAFCAQNPVTSELLSPFYNCQTQEVTTATHAAWSAFLQFSRISPIKRSEFLSTIAEEIQALGDDLLTFCNEECGLGIPRLTGERTRTLNQINAFAKIVKDSSWVQASIDTAEPQRQPLPKPDLRKMLKPIGPIAVFGASNFPFAFGALGGDTISALAAGNTVVLKGHPTHPTTNALLARAIDKAITKCGMPNGVFSLLQGNEISLSEQLVTDPLIQGVGFTGSLQGGRAIMNAAAKRDTPIPVFAEMGSTNPMFFTHKVLQQDANNLATKLAASVCMGTGQFCTSPGIIVIEKHPDFIEAFTQGLNSQPKTPMLNKNIGTAFVAGVKDFIAYNDVQWLNKKDNALLEPLMPASILLSTSATAFLNNEAMQNEIFGPATLLVECDNEQQMLAVANVLKGNLTSSIHATEQDQGLIAELLPVLEQKAGRIIFNGFPTGVEVCGSQHHGGPYPASSNGASTSVGIDAIHRFAKFVAYQDTPAYLLPPELADENPRKIVRRINGCFTASPVKQS
ncbi:aldehyde dehydrogenase (NADP(+)) [Aliiglaciecola sp. 2_MG-2023]|uniref:aldehyde dehydrogenase (NADP(+)) n=1 Tax=unclassified Aliiglaciecola TaxID=2593648 RepID=UPI0026E2CA60|nr:MULTISPECIES: aldehyde dehydrogenase (NADP(+)) [unclassified Aliiglaciecola]MDO6712406.1 aldehyde dehydrogenase (NADP(+)) [Aliiglaciecola sp. 2_MG-2023]MDO6753400.1 aldehyde dehydrogenase (NADP(+)) [Aliiglaciecola sp. 1_MG-2023]